MSVPFTLPRASRRQWLRALAALPAIGAGWPLAATTTRAQDSLPKAVRIG